MNPPWIDKCVLHLPFDAKLADVGEPTVKNAYRGNSGPGVSFHKCRTLRWRRWKVNLRKQLQEEIRVTVRESCVFEKSEMAILIVLKMLKVIQKNKF